MADKLVNDESLIRWKENYRPRLLLDLQLELPGDEVFSSNDSELEMANKNSLSELNIELHEVHPDFLNNRLDCFSLGAWNRFIIDECRQTILDELRSAQNKIFNIVKEINVTEYRLKMLEEYSEELLDTQLKVSLEYSISCLQKKLSETKEECKLLNIELKCFDKIQNNIQYFSEDGREYYSQKYINDGWE